MIKHIIYRTTHKITGEFYIGLTKWDTTKPIRYWGSYWHRQPRSVRPYLVRETLAEYPDRASARQAEPHWIEPHLGDPLCMNSHARELKEEQDRYDKPGTRLGKTTPQETRKRISENHVGMKGQKHTEETLAKMRKPKPQVKCPHCGTIGSVMPMHRWHFDKCKEKPQLSIII